MCEPSQRGLLPLALQPQNDTSAKVANATSAVSPRNTASCTMFVSIPVPIRFRIRKKKPLPVRDRQGLGHITAAITRLLGVVGNLVLTRLLGVILAALAVQFVIDGVRAAAGG